MNPCPKCGHVRTEDEASFPADQCPACGVYYDKALKVKLLREQEAAKKQAKPAPAPTKQASAFGAFKAEDKSAQAKPAPKREDKPRTTICDDCGGVVSLSAKKCPHCGAKMHRPATRGQVIAVLLFAGFIIYGMAKNSSEPRDNRPSLAVYACKQSVEAHLKTPSTARFLDDKSSYGQIEGKHYAQVTVDAQNAFGAMLRKRFTCELTPTGSGFVVKDVQEE